MLKHIVMWKLRNKADAAEIKARLEALNGEIPGLLSIEVGVDVFGSEQAADLVLIATLEGRKALDTYQAHAKHQAVIPLLKAATRSRTVVDYEL